MERDFVPTPYGEPNAWLSCLTIDLDESGVTPEVVRLALEAEDIETRPLWKPMHLQPVFAEARAIGGEVCADLFARGLCLPSGSSLTEADRDRVIEIAAGCGLG
jgi:dTDP-4-amino-4,6-dideoxygalactose transaminase